MCSCRFLITLTFYILAIPGECVGQDDNSLHALALLRGVEHTRTREDVIRAEFQVSLDAPVKSSFRFLVEMEDENSRFEVLPGSDHVSSVVIRNGDLFMGYRRKKHEDIHLFDQKRSVGTRGDFAFDPRILGLIDTLYVGTKVRQCLGFEKNNEKIDIVGNKKINGIECAHVQLTRSGVKTNFWIEETSFRVHKCEIKLGEIHIVVDSKYNASNATSPLPDRVSIHRTEDGVDKIKMEIVVDSIAFGGPIPAERFSIASVGVPLNTAAIDYRINQTVGFWDGNGFNEMRVQENQKTLTRPTAGFRNWLVWVAIALVAVIGTAFFLGRTKQIN